jgi:hypothetical protein
MAVSKEVTEPRYPSGKVEVTTKRFGSVMVSVLTSSAVDREFKLRSGQSNEY